MPEEYDMIDITPETMNGVRVLRNTGYPHAHDMHFAFLTAPEIDHAACNFPIALIKSPSGDTYNLVALLGLNNDENLFIEPDNQRNGWRGTYIPASIARYPFLLRAPEGEMSQDNPPIFCLQKDPRYIVEGGDDGELLYDENGQETRFHGLIRQTVQNFSVGVAETGALIESLKKHDLIREMTVTFTMASGAKHNLQGLHTVNREAFWKLSDEQVLELHKSGVLNRATVMSTSLTQLNRLVQYRNMKNDDQIVSVQVQDPVPEAAVVG